MRIYLLFASFLMFFSNSVFAETVDKSQVKLPIARNGEIIDSVGSGAIDPVLNVVETEGEISYVTGGVGDEEIAFLKEQEANFNTRILIRAKNGEYMSDLDIRFFDSKNMEILHIEGAGPYLYANLPAGIYNLEITSIEGVIKKSKIKLSGKEKNIYITFAK